MSILGSFTLGNWVAGWKGFNCASLGNYVKEAHLTHTVKKSRHVKLSPPRSLVPVHFGLVLVQADHLCSQLVQIAWKAKQEPEVIQ